MFFLLSRYAEKISRRKRYLVVIMQVVSVSSTWVKLTSSEMILLWKIRILCSLAVVDQIYLLWGPEVLLPYFCRLDSSEKWPEGDRKKGKTLWGGRNSSRSKTGRAGGWPIIAVPAFDNAEEESRRTADREDWGRRAASRSAAASQCRRESVRISAR